MSALLGDQQFADVRFLVEGKELFAHRFVLESRSEYFAAMFHSGMTEASESSDQVVEVIVPDSFVGFLRLLTFLYTNCLPEGAYDVLLDDLLTADRYGLVDMKLFCESMLRPDADNWLDMYKVACDINATRIIMAVKLFLCEHIAEMNAVTEQDAIALGIDLKDLKETVMQMRRDAFPLPPSQLLVDLSKFNADKQENDNSIYKSDIPIWIIAVMFILCAIFPYVKPIFIFGPLIPFINAIFLFGMFYTLFRYYFKIAK